MTIRRGATAVLPPPAPRAGGGPRSDRRDNAVAAGGPEEAGSSPGAPAAMNEMTFAELLDQAKAGDEQAIGSLLSEFESDVRLAVRRQLPRVLRTQFDSIIAKSSYAELVKRLEASRNRSATPEAAKTGESSR